MTVKDVIDGFREGAEENTERDAYANELFHLKREHKSIFYRRRNGEDMICLQQET